MVLILPSWSGKRQDSQELMTTAGVAYESRNILEDPDVREAVKKFTEWPTIPQVSITADSCCLYLLLHLSLVHPDLSQLTAASCARLAMHHPQSPKTVTAPTCNADMPHGTFSLMESFSTDAVFQLLRASHCRHLFDHVPYFLNAWSTFPTKALKEPLQVASLG